MKLTTQIIRLHKALAEAGLPHAFGGALALAWCTKQARGTIDIDINVFVDQGRLTEVLSALPKQVKVSAEALSRLQSDGQARLWWGPTPVDLFLNTTPLHQGMARRASTETFAGHAVPFLSCQDLALFKAYFNRTKDWADLEAMKEAGTLDLNRLRADILQTLGDSDERQAHLDRL
jgi:hypothetical protein